MSDMSEPRKVWAVTYGQYSDWGIDCLFVNRDDAIAHAAKSGDGPDRVEEYRLFDGTPDYWERWEVGAVVWSDGRVDRYEPTNWTSHYEKIHRPKVTVFPYRGRFGKRDAVSVQVDGSSLESVEKALTERVAFVKATPMMFSDAWDPY